MIPSHDDLASDGSERDREFSLLHLCGGLSDKQACGADPNSQAQDNGLLHDQFSF
jgi:hypothetical protein